MNSITIVCNPARGASRCTRAQPLAVAEGHHV